MTGLVVLGIYLWAFVLRHNQVHYESYMAYVNQENEYNNDDH